MAAARGTRALSAEKRYDAMVLGDGSILPIIETLGRRQLREIDPLCAEGRRLLTAGRVRLCFEDGRRVDAVPIAEVLEEMVSSTRSRRGVYPPRVSSWAAHHDGILRRLGRMKRILKPQT